MTLPRLEHNVKLAPYTTFKIGGAAKYFVIVKNKEELVTAVAEAQKNKEQWFILGGGSDILVADSGFNGLVIKSELKQVNFDLKEEQVRAESGVRLNQLITSCLQKELSGLEFAIGVPATVGGATWANLGARGQELQNYFLSAQVIDVQGNTRVIKKKDCAFGYRDSIFKHQKFIILEVLFQLRQEEKAKIQQAIKQLTDLRQTTQDLSSFSAGCVFKNPTDQTTVPAAKLIDDLDLKGKKIGGAQISSKHANFIINTGTATAEDVIMLISYIKQQVRDKCGVQLQEEIEY